MNINYTVADPTGNITVLVTDPVSPEDRAEITKEIFDTVPGCEQVGYICPPVDPAAALRLEMMGGEFCGNASLSAAAWHFAGDPDLTASPDFPADILMECSGVNAPFVCSIIPSGENTCTGTLAMPVPEKTETMDSFPVIFLPGIAHMIVPAGSMTRERAEERIRDYASRTDAGAFGILLWDEERSFMTPCVYVKGSGTIVWEKGCATGSACIGWYNYVNEGRTRTEVHQPGGCISINISDGRPFLTGNVILR